MARGSVRSASPPGPPDPRAAVRRVRSRLAVFGALVVVVPALVGAGPTGASAPRPVGLLVPVQGAYFGAHVQSTQASPAVTMADVTALESKLGRVLDIEHYYHSFADPFPNWREQWDLSTGRIPFISWAGISTAEVASGADDALIVARADGIKALGQPVFLRWFWEMDAKSNAARAVSPASYIAAWNHLRAVFAARGVTNAAWVWCPTSYGFKTGTAQSFYPGDGAVDWICADGYNWAPGKPGSKWVSFEKVFDAFYAWGVQRPHPMIVGEYGAQERSPGEKAAWVLDARATMQSKFTNIAGLVYFDANKVYDWRMDTSSSALDAFRTTALDPYFNPTHATGIPGGGTPSGGGGNGSPGTTTTSTRPSPIAPPPSSTTTTTPPKHHGGTGNSQDGNGQQ